MDYGRIYRDFIADRRRIEPTLEGYTEKHHILPRALGGGNEAENLIRLTAEDHFFAHLLLAKMHGRGMWIAVRRMLWGRNSGERPWVAGRPMYAFARQRCAEETSRRCKGQPGNRGAKNGRYSDRVFQWINLDTGSVVRATIWEMWDAYGGSRPTWTTVAIGYRMSMRGWTAQPEAVRIRGNKGKSFEFVNRDGRIFVGTQSAFVTAARVSPATASRVTRHQDITKCGWRLSTTEDRPHWAPRDGVPVWHRRLAKK